MDHLHASRWFPVALLAGVTVVCLLVSLGSAEPPKPATEQTVYDADPQHLWNRLYETLFVRVGPDGDTYGSDRFEPLLWLGSKHLLEGPSQDRAVKVLSEFLDKQAENRTDDPLKRALLQRDLWMLFSWLQGMHTYGAGSGVPPEKLAAAQQRLGRPLAAVLRRLAMSPDQVKKLQDHYAEAAKRSGLPADLFAADGPWVCVGRSDGPVAQMHVQESNTLANSAFLIFLRLPGGRDAARKYLKQGTGDLPAGAEVALVRRALLIAAPADVTPTNLVESVQLRGYGERELSVSEFRLSRALLLAGKAGGLRAVGDGERDFKTGFASHNGDPFEEPPVGQDFRVRQVDLKAECRGCHDRARFPGLRAPRPLVEVSVTEAMETAVKWNRDRADWKALRKLWEQ
jgi:hypothetical protein